MTEQWDVVVVGAGPGGLAAGAAARQYGASRVLILERDKQPGGILNQCIHDGFGLVHYREALTGPEYALRALAEARDAGAQISCGQMALDIGPQRTVTVAGRGGLRVCEAGAVVLATGCRERTRGAISIPGQRPAGVYTAGVAQNLINVRNILPGRRAVILGSGDIGLIMARRLTLEGAQVPAVIELLPSPSGLKRNVSQCLYDFGIPLHTGCTVTEVLGQKRVTGVRVAQVQDGKILEDTQRLIPCDTLILSVGLIPENEVGKTAGLSPDADSGNMPTDARLQTAVPGIFACGNARGVMDLADYVTRQGTMAGRNAAAFSMGRPLPCTAPADGPGMPKGFPSPDTAICNRCPQGCEVALEAGGKPKGHRCPQGEDFARQERADPARTLTTTMATQSGRLLPVRSSVPVPRRLMAEMVSGLAQAAPLCGDIFCGQVLISNFMGSGADILATASIQEQDRIQNGGLE